jgi:integrase
MARPRSGIAFEQHGAIYCGVRLADGKRRTWPVAQLLPPPAGIPLSLDWARVVSRKLQERYDATGALPDLQATPAPTQAPAPVETVASYVLRWIERQTYESAPNDRSAALLYASRSPALSVPLTEARPRHLLGYIEELAARPSEQGGTIASRTQRNAFDIVRRALDHAVLMELIPRNPCVAVRSELPAIEDKDPTERATWKHSRADVEALLSPHPRIPADHRVRMALAYCCGARIGEINALRWSDWDRTREPLTQLAITRAIKSVSGREGSTKTGAHKLAPVHRVLETELAWWWEEGWEQTYGRAPTLADLLVPGARGPERTRLQPIESTAWNRAFKRAQGIVGVSRVLHFHATRHTFISRAQDDGADGAVLQWVTHAPPRTAFNGYSRASWDRLCAEVAKLRLFEPVPGSVTGSVTSAVSKSNLRGEFQRVERKHTGIEPLGHHDTAGLRRVEEVIGFDWIQYVTDSVTGYDEMLVEDFLSLARWQREGKLRRVKP